MTLTTNLMTGLIKPLITGLINTGSSTLWQPTDLSGLLAWYDASDSDTVLQTTTAGRVKTWNDKSGNDQHLTVANATNEPVTGADTINGLNAISFKEGIYYLDPVGDRSGTITGLDARDVSIFIVAQRTVADSQGGVLSLKSTTGSDFIATDFNTTGNSYFPENTGGSTSYLIDTPSTFTNGSPFLLSMNCDDTDMKYYNEGVEIAATGAGASSNHFNRFIVGYRDASSRDWDGDIAEIIVANSLSVADQQAVEGYLANKWGF